MFFWHLLKFDVEIATHCNYAYVYIYIYYTYMNDHVCSCACTGVYLLVYGYIIYNMTVDTWLWYVNVCNHIYIYIHAYNYIKYYIYMCIALICIASFVYVEYREVMQSKAKHRQESTVMYCNWCIFYTFGIIYIGNTLFSDRHITIKKTSYTMP